MIKKLKTLLFLFKIALQVIVLIKRAARGSIETRDKGLDDFMPDKKDYRTPRPLQEIKADLKEMEIAGNIIPFKYTGYQYFLRAMQLSPAGYAERIGLNQ